MAYLPSVDTLYAVKQLSVDMGPAAPCVAGAALAAKGRVSGLKMLFGACDIHSRVNPLLREEGELLRPEPWPAGRMMVGTLSRWLHNNLHGS